tara:strand:- start:443 stop:739 length:297 start_codon:yes stop_codon:yes gene_type:complete
MLFNKNKELRKNQRLIEEFLGINSNSKMLESYNKDWNQLIIVYKQIGDLLFDDLTSESEIELIESSFENLDYWILTNDKEKAYNAIMKFIKKYFNEDE